jgi:hypothetical protein
VNSIFAPTSFSFGGIAIDRNTPSNDPGSLWLADGIHAGTIGQGLLANLFVNAANEEFQTHIRPLSEREILQNAGLRGGNHQATRPECHAVANEKHRPRTLFAELEVKQEGGPYHVLSAAS